MIILARNAACLSSIFPCFSNSAQSFHAERFLFVRSLTLLVGLFSLDRPLGNARRYRWTSDIDPAPVAWYHPSEAQLATTLITQHRFLRGLGPRSPYLGAIVWYRRYGAGNVGGRLRSRRQDLWRGIRGTFVGRGGKIVEFGFLFH